MASRLRENLTEIKTKLNDYNNLVNVLLGNIDADVLKPYIELEYIESTGKQYIDTGILVGDYQVQTRGRMLNTKDNTFYFGNNYYHIGIYSSKTFSAFYSGNKELFLGDTSIMTNTFEMTFNDSNHRVIINNSIIRSDFLVTNQSLTIGIFGRGNFYESWRSSSRLYYLKIINNSTGKLVRDFIPVIEKSTNKVCLYDKVEEKFYYNVGKGEFVAGGRV